ncbi:hypothetical protein CEXT_574231 [Caerostris extrusa]|uniref:Uncharacterized protein n=1 Tax=Caerostris extrusa TaxID=172846 RepID=A0AAV4PAR4_CAEEX|nr:hypothetical protein CEXT_574231 [Caerostris extrusa]
MSFLRVDNVYIIAQTRSKYFIVYNFLVHSSAYQAQYNFYSTGLRSKTACLRQLQRSHTKRIFRNTFVCIDGSCKSHFGSYQGSPWSEVVRYFSLVS